MASYAGLVTANHQAIALFQAPDSAADAHVKKAYAPLLQHPGSADAVLVEGVSTINDYVPGGEKATEGADGGLGRVSGGGHYPYRPGRGQPVYQFSKGANSRCSLGFDDGYGFRVGVVSHDVVTAPHEAQGHVGAHPPEANHTEFQCLAFRFAMRLGFHVSRSIPRLPVPDVIVGLQSARARMTGISHICNEASNLKS